MLCFQLAGVYKNVVGTDTSKQQLAFASKLPNIHYVQTPPNMPLSNLERKVAEHETVDLVTVAQAIHWFDLPTFYQQVKWVLKKPNGVLAVWCYLEPMVNEAVDTVFWKMYNEFGPYLAPARKLVDD
ncbi:Methyltransferase, partial [Thalictrum thalictroides]